MGTAEALGGFFQYEPRNAFRVGEDVVVPNADDAPAFGFQKCGSAIVISLLFDMLATVEFNSELRFAAREIENVRAHDKLSGETRPMAR